MSDFWKASTDIHKQMLALIGKNHPDLALVSDEIVIVFKEKASKSGGRPVMGTASRVSARMNALGNTDYKFILELAADVWEHELTSRQREALLDHLLCFCTSELDEKTGEPKCAIRRPDILAFTDNLGRYGNWFPKFEEEGEEGDGNKAASTQVDVTEILNS